MAELDDALTDFAACRSARIADAIDALGRAAAADFALPKITKNFAYHQAWLAGIADPTTRSWFLDKVLDKLPKLYEGKEHGAGNKSEAIAERFAALATLPCDPRIGRAVLAIAALRAPVCGFEDAFLAMRDALVAHADDAAASSPALEELAWVETDEAALANKLPKPAKGKQIERWSKHASPTKQKLDATALFAAVYADPDSDGPREVLADALQAAGDPLGELMSLQLLPADPEQAPARRARIRELVQTHHLAWLGPLYELARGARFDRGFVTRISVTKPAWSETDLRWAIDEPVYAQVRELCYPRFLEVEIHAKVAYVVRELPALRAVEVDRVSVLEARRR